MLVQELLNEVMARRSQLQKLITETESMLEHYINLKPSDQEARIFLNFAQKSLRVQMKETLYAFQQISETFLQCFKEAPKELVVATENQEANQEYRQV